MEKIKEYFSKYGYVLDDDKAQKLKIYYEYLVEQNKVMNLTGIVDFEEVIIKHFIDSLAINKLNIDLNNKKLADVGTGAGFPGMVIAIMHPNTKVTLIDSLNKRICFLERLKEKIGINNVECIHIRGEDYAKNYENRFDIVVSRAVAYMDKLIKYCLPIMKKNGKFIAYKGIFDEKEEKIAKDCLYKLGYTIENKISFNLTENDNKRTLVEISKLTSTR